ncbi:MAG: hypothetical protein A2Y62_13520 [Candidatus Fischerbacteria bacterium RBG_13_37_8]|uniref:Toxin-antitoxin system HicB family antitoxin n=1 Tax=Candidatus Fischerbacteria bacterium RBG_13_37_8 TaxID=1817863 RepID=A0A1F5VLV9_9BACT|nr:MAG: hypothetical protein A2Y62_13520 [Candidatus Fischerbacteria bacterium RBG_13_37_8]
MKKLTEKEKKLRHYMKLPYSIKLIPEQKGHYFAEIEEFNGCMAHGETAEEALKNVEISKEMWLDSMLDKNMEIPEPKILREYSGRFIIRIPASLHRRIAILAKKEGASINQMVLSLLSEKIAAREIESDFRNAISKD